VDRIRTCGEVASTHAFQTCLLTHSKHHSLFVVWTTTLPVWLFRGNHLYNNSKPRTLAAFPRVSLTVPRVSAPGEAAIERTPMKSELVSTDPALLRHWHLVRAYALGYSYSHFTKNPAHSQLDVTRTNFCCFWISAAHPTTAPLWVVKWSPKGCPHIEFMHVSVSCGLVTMVTTSGEPDVNRTRFRWVAATCLSI
jgi:hypothetical protein